MYSGQGSSHTVPSWRSSPQWAASRYVTAGAGQMLASMTQRHAHGPTFEHAQCSVAMPRQLHHDNMAAVSHYVAAVPLYTTGYVQMPIYSARQCPQDPHPPPEKDPIKRPLTATRKN